MVSLVKDVNQLPSIGLYLKVGAVLHDFCLLIKQVRSVTAEIDFCKQEKNHLLLRRPRTLVINSFRFDLNVNFRIKF